MYKFTQNGGITKDGSTLPAQWVNGALVELDEHSPFVIELREWIAQGNVPEAADAPPPNAAIDAQITALENLRPFTHRFFRDLTLAAAVKGLVSPTHPVVAAAIAEDAAATALRAQRV